MQPELLPEDAVAERLKRHGITPTRPRVAVGRLLFAAPQHVSADQVQLRLSQAGLRVSRATVYNTLSLFAEKGLLREVVVDASRMFYDSNVAPHHHLFHTDSGRLEDVPADQVRITGLPALPAGATLQGLDVIIRVSGAGAD